jgi:hypothetical protein
LPILDVSAPAGCRARLQAKALGLAVPEKLLALADEVIE